jgi:hypothetical protein
MPSLKTKSWSLAATLAALLLLPCGAAAAPVPPGNPAATQYTEAFPTAGGQQDAEQGKGGKGRHPNQVLGKEKARRLESQGPAGRAAATLAAETAPAGVASESGAGGDSGHPSGGANGNGTPHSGGGDGKSGQPAGGGSGLGEVTSQATGSSFSDGTDLLLPLAILGTVAWLLVYLLRRRQRPAE